MSETPMTEWQKVAYGDKPSARAGISYLRERGWPVDDETFPNRARVEEKMLWFKAGYEVAVEESRR